jgi:uncharacterized membrane-anchored protein YhcB (DUF1043 family)
MKPGTSKTTAVVLVGVSFIGFIAMALWHERTTESEQLEQELREWQLQGWFEEVKEEREREFRDSGIRISL